MFSRACSSGSDVQNMSIRVRHSALDDLDTSFHDFFPMPAPMPFKASQKQSVSLVLSEHTSMVIVSSSKPYRILSISERLASLLEYEPSILCGRSISTLQGPKSYSAALDSAIGNAGKWADTRTPFVLYSSSGTEHETDVQCIPLFDESGKTYAYAFESRLGLEQSAFCACLENNRSVSSKRGQQIREYRKLYNFRTGLSIQKAVNRYQLAVLAEQGIDGNIRRNTPTRTPADASASAVQHD